MRRFTPALFLTAAALAALPLLAVEQQVNVVTFPDRQSIDLKLSPTNRAPNATASAEVEARGGQAAIEIRWKGLQPAVLFGGDVTAYTVWSVTRDGTAVNLGELPVRDPSGKAKFQAASKEFGLMVTASAWAGLPRPSDIVVFVNAPTDPKKAKSAPASFTAFARIRVKRGNDSIAGMSWKGTQPIELIQAQKMMELAQTYNVTEYDATAIKDASTTLAQAENLDRAGNEKSAADFARRTSDRLGASLIQTVRKMNEEEAAAETAKRKAEMEALSQKAATAEQTAATEAAAREKAEAELEGALGKIAETRRTARGLAVDLPGVFFDTGKATLKPSSQVTLAKLSTLASLYPEYNIRIEGYTDSTGSENTNMKLSRDRALSVLNFLKQNGVEEHRMKAEGYGPQFALADNKTADGRAKNRRVQVIVAKGEIQDATSAQAH
ncbi:MAG: OmpA family protein [Thermoanaerobaculia bacterium]